MIFNFFSKKIGFYAAIAGLWALLIAWLRFETRQAQHKDTQIEDYKNASDIEERVANSRSDAERLRKYDDAGWRD